MYIEDDKDSNLETDLVAAKFINCWYLLDLVCYEIDGKFNSAAFKVGAVYAVGAASNFRLGLAVAGAVKEVLAAKFCGKLTKS